MDLTTILAAAIAGLSGVAAGYLGMRQQTRTLRDQLSAERNRDLSKRKETLQDQRAQTYGSLLNVERGLRLLLASGKSFSYDDYSKWWHDYGELTSLVVITGTAVVSSQAQVLERLYGQIDDDRMNVASERLAHALTLAFQRHEPEIEQARAELIELMRADVAPDDQRVLVKASGVRPTTADVPGPAKTHIDHRDVAVIATAKDITIDRLREVVAAVQEQVNRDFGPAWGVSASLTVYEDAKQIAPGAWRITVATDIGEPGMASFHSSQDGIPFTMVSAMQGWELFLSHDCLEMLANPFDEIVKEGPSPKPGEGRVQFSVQVCDPCPTVEQGYAIGGVTVSDFILPEFYDLTQRAGTRYDHKGVIGKPFEVTVGGYLTWYDRNHLWQVRQSGNRHKYTDLGRYDGIEAAIKALSPKIGFFGSPT